MSKNAVAVNILRSWLRATGISHKRSEIPGCDLEVVGKHGSLSQVIVALRSDETAPCDAIVIRAKDLTGKNKDLAVAAFHTVTRGAGYGQPDLFSRGEEPKQKLSYHKDEFLVAVRATETRRSPDPTPEQFAKYDKVMWKAAQLFFNINYEDCRRWGYSTDDLMQHNRVLLINFCARYEKDEFEEGENERLLYTYLSQRLSELRSILFKKERSILPDADTVSISLLGKNYGGSMTIGIEYEYDPRSDNDVVDQEHKHRNKVLDCSNPTTRKASASRLLADSLASLSHADMIETLVHAEQNILFSHDARREAGKQLKMHYSSCDEPDCVSARTLGPINEHEDLASDDGASS